MRRRFQGLSRTSAAPGDEVPVGVFLVRVERAQYHWHAQKPYYLLRLCVIEPKQFTSQFIVGRVYCTPKALWKLSWFLRDFGYDAELFGQDEIEDKRLIGLRGVVKINHVVRNGTSFLNLEAFAPASQWEELFAGNGSQATGSELSS